MLVGMNHGKAWSKEDMYIKQIRVQGFAYDWQDGDGDGEAGSEVMMQLTADLHLHLQNLV